MDGWARYGEIFKTRILGCRCVMMASPEAARLVLANRAGIFRPTFPGSKMSVIGRQALFFHEGPYHARLRRLFLASFAAPDSIRRCLPELELLAIATIDSWPRLHSNDKADDGGAGAAPINAFAELKKVRFRDPPILLRRLRGSKDRCPCD
jgi:(+)-abscisic acid 8'-hydroxylase